VALTPGTRLGPYEISAPLGAGGMGEVYRATDTRLNRVVAIKILPAHLSLDVERRRRFEREAKAISALSHPNICTLFDVGRERDIDYLVLEFVDGESLEDRLNRGPLPIEAALRRGVEIADALGVAHRGGVVHRDLKPGNVLLARTPGSKARSGTRASSEVRKSAADEAFQAKVVDFGLAKIMEDADDLEETQTKTLTDAGAIVGTFQYMAPEQLEGGDVDARSDIFSFGALLYETLTGRKAFAGKSRASLIGAILKDDPPALSSVVPLAPIALDHVLSKCLAKDPDHRWQDARDLRDELKWVADRRSAVPTAMPVTSTRSRAVMSALVGALLVAVVALASGYLQWFRRAAPTADVVRFTIELPPHAWFSPLPVAPFQTVSPNGKWVVFQAGGGSTPLARVPSLWLRSLDSVEARPLAGTNGAALSLWSPDSRSLAFFVIAERALKRLDLSGGAPETITTIAQANTEGASWGPDGTILFGSAVGLFRVAAAGGPPAQITKLRTGETAHTHPFFLPDGRHFLFRVQSTQNSIWLGSLDSAATTQLFVSDSRAMVASGHVLFVKGGVLFAQVFDTRRFKTTGDPIALVPGVETTPQNGRSAFAVSDTGVLVYRAGISTLESPLGWYDHAGRRLSVGGTTSTSTTTGTYAGLELFPDERHVMISLPDPVTSADDLWKIDLEHGTRTRVTFGLGRSNTPVLSPDGTRVLFRSDRTGHGDLYWRTSDGAGPDELLLASEAEKYPTDWSTHWIVFETGPVSHRDVWYMPVDGERKPTLYLGTRFNQRQARLSPDERWIAYASDEAGPPHIYIRPFPDANAGKWQVSTAPGTRPRWRPDGKGLYYIALDRNVMEVPLTFTARSLEAAQPVVFKPNVSGGGMGTVPYVVSKDGTRVLMPVDPVEDQPGGAQVTPLTVVLNWPTLIAPR